MKMSMGYPTPEQEMEIISARKGEDPLAAVVPVVSCEEVVQLQKAVDMVYVEDQIRNYIVELVCATRGHHLIDLAASPRASLSLMRAASAAALLEGRAFVTPKDVMNLYDAVVSHRIMLAPEAKIERMTASQLLASLQEKVKVPVVK